MGELPPERMRKAVNAASKAMNEDVFIEGITVPWMTAERVALAVVDAVLPFLSAPPPQLPAEPSEEAKRAAVKAAAEAGGYTPLIGAARIEKVVRAAYAVDSRPSLDLTEQEVAALVATPSLASDMGPKKRALDKLRAELARRQGTGQ